MRKVYQLFEGNTYGMQRTFHEAFINTSSGESCPSEGIALCHSQRREGGKDYKWSFHQEACAAVRQLRTGCHEETFGIGPDNIGQWMLYHPRPFFCVVYPETGGNEGLHVEQDSGTPIAWKPVGMPEVMK